MVHPVHHADKVRVVGHDGLVMLNLLNLLENAALPLNLRARFVANENRLVTIVYRVQVNRTRTSIARPRQRRTQRRSTEGRLNNLD